MAGKTKVLRTAPVRKPRKTANKAGVSEVATQLRYKMFAEAWLANGGNAADAARQAGYSEKTARQQGSRLLTHVDVVRLIRAGQERLAKKFEVQADRVLREIAILASSRTSDLFGSDGQMIPPHLWPDHVSAAVSSVKMKKLGEIEVRLWNKPAALTDAAKHLGLFEKDNAQKTDPAVALMEHIAKHNTGIPVRT